MSRGLVAGEVNWSWAPFFPTNELTTWAQEPQLLCQAVLLGHPESGIFDLSCRKDKDSRQVHHPDLRLKGWTVCRKLEVALNLSHLGQRLRA